MSSVPVTLRLTKFGLVRGLVRFELQQAVTHRLDGMGSMIGSVRRCFLIFPILYTKLLGNYIDST